MATPSKSFRFPLPTSILNVAECGSISSCNCHKFHLAVRQGMIWPPCDPWSRTDKKPNDSLNKPKFSSMATSGVLGKPGTAPSISRKSSLRPLPPRLEWATDHQQVGGSLRNQISDKLNPSFAFLAASRQGVVSLAGRRPLRESRTQREENINRNYRRSAGESILRAGSVRILKCKRP